MWRVARKSSVKNPLSCTSEGYDRRLKQGRRQQIAAGSVCSNRRDAEQPKGRVCALNACALSRFLSKLSISNIMCLWLKGLAGGNPVLEEINFQK